MSETMKRFCLVLTKEQKRKIKQKSKKQKVSEAEIIRSLIDCELK